MDLEKQEFELKEIFNFLWKAKLIIFMFIVIFAALTYCAANIFNKNTYKAEAVIGFSFEGIDEGLYPDGSNFSYNALKNTTFITNALEKLDLHALTANTVQEHITITPIIPDDILAITERRLKLGEQYMYHSNTYHIEFQYGRMKELKDTVHPAIDLLHGIIEEYQLWFDKRYLSLTYISDMLEEVPMDDYEYIDLIDLYRERMENVEIYLYEKEKEAPLFRSSNNELAFSDLIQSLHRLSSLDLTDIEAYVQTNRIFKDIDWAQKTTEFKIQQNQLELRRIQSELKSLQTILDSYLDWNAPVQNEDMIASDSQQNLRTSSTPYKEKLMEQYLNTSKMKNKLEQKTNDLMIRQEHLKDKKSKKQIDSASEKEVVHKINALTAVMNEWSNTADAVLKDYMSTIMGNSVKLVSPVQLEKESVAAPVILGGGVGGGVGFIAAYLNYTNRNKGKSKKELDTNKI